MFSLNKKASESYKIGINEVEGLRETMTTLMKPVQAALKENVYWNDVDLDQAEYKSRDGFIANSHNYGGITINLVIPKCEEYEFSYLEFGECDTPEECEDECICECEGHLDAALNIWFKFEGLNKDGSADFYLCLHGGNGDAPYFRTKYSTDIFGTEFQATGILDLQSKAQKHIETLIRLINKG